METMMTLTFAATIVSTILLGMLLGIYYSNFKKIKSPFTIGLFVFGILFIVQNIISIYFYLTMMDYYVPGVTLHVFIMTLLQVIAFAVLLKITRE